MVTVHYIIFLKPLLICRIPSLFLPCIYWRNWVLYRVSSSENFDDCSYNCPFINFFFFCVLCELTVRSSGLIRFRISWLTELTLPGIHSCRLSLWDISSCWWSLCRSLNSLRVEKAWYSSSLISSSFISCFIVSFIN